MKLNLERILIALCFALLAAGLTLIMASAQSGTDAPTAGSDAQPFTQDCAVCHTEFATAWQSGAHGQATHDPVFVEAWNEQGKPGACLVCHTTGYDPATATYQSEGVTCEACHGPIPTDHPKSPMPVDRSTDLCGQCHSDTRFGWQDWKVSTHYQRGMDCTTCHDPHTASLKKVTASLDGSAPTDEVSQLCINCHQETSMDFPYTKHHQQGVACVDCHVNHLESGDRTAHTVPDHSFNASLQSCNTCHEQQMHSSTEAVKTLASETVNSNAQSDADVKLAALSPEPDPASPIGFAAVAGMIGLAGGMVLAPWLERWYRHLSKHDPEESHDQANH